MDWQQLAISMLTLFLPLEGDNFLSLSTILHQNESVFCFSSFCPGLAKCISQTLPNHTADIHVAGSTSDPC